MGMKIPRRSEAPPPGEPCAARGAPARRWGILLAWPRTAGRRGFGATSPRDKLTGMRPGSEECRRPRAGAPVGEHAGETCEGSHSRAATDMDGRRGERAMQVVHVRCAGLDVQDRKSVG